MKIFLTLLALSLNAFAGSIPLKWPASPTVGVTYVLYATTNNTLVETNLNLSQVIVNVGTNTQVIAYTLPAGDGMDWKFAVTSSLGSAQSSPSSVTIISFPLPAGNVIPMVLLYSGTLEGLGTSPTNIYLYFKPVK